MSFWFCFRTVFEAEIDSVLGRLLDMAAVDTALKHTLAIV